MNSKPTISDRAGLKLVCCNGTLVKSPIKRTFPWYRSKPDARIEGSTSLAIDNGHFLAKPYSVNCWGSHPDDGNDDCWSGEDFATLTEAEAAAANWREIFGFVVGETTHVEIVAWTGHVMGGLMEYERISVTQVVSDEEIQHRAKRDRERSERDSRQWRHEIAMQAGMGTGIDAYNETMGWD